jgi:regulatory protein
MIIKKQITKEEALQKIRHYCDYQKRSHSETRKKLYSLGLWKNDVEDLLAHLIEENYLNEEGFAIAFARGKFRMKQWGKVKIKNELKLKQVSNYCINKALNEIKEEDYLHTFEKLAKKRIQSLKSEKNIFIKKRKVQDHLLQKGYEWELVSKIVANM